MVVGSGESVVDVVLVDEVVVVKPPADVVVVLSPGGSVEGGTQAAATSVAASKPAGRSTFDVAVMSLLLPPGADRLVVLEGQLKMARP
jgi:hypothetical protein